MNFSLLLYGALLVVSASQAEFNHLYSPFSAAQSIEQKCPTIEINSPEISNEDKPLILKVTVSEVEKDTKLEYEWTVSRGKIIAGQGTPKLTVEAERNGHSITATVKIEGLPEDCANVDTVYISHY